ncbi:MAG: hypothetical protein H7257_11625 [Taibaiella sp.]|nr:hypothetical protein [Taibaiella sp.]
MGTLYSKTNGEAQIGEDPEYILNEFAAKIADQTDNEFFGMVLRTINSESAEVIYSFYIVAPKLNDYMYRIIEVLLTNINDPYPLMVRLLAQESRDIKYKRCGGKEEYKKCIDEYLYSDITKNILAHIGKLIEIRNIDSNGQFNAIAVNINRRFKEGISPTELYDVTRMAWAIDSNKKDKIKYVICQYNREVKEVYKVDDWFPINVTDDYGNDRIRWAFNGHEAEDSIRKKYIHKPIPYVTQRGQANPIKYINLDAA